MGEAVRQYQEAALPHISETAVCLGVPFENSKSWIESGSSVGQWYRKDERDRVHFDMPAPVLQVRRVRGEVVPVGERDTELLTVNEYEPYGREYEVTGGYTRKRGLTISDETSNTYGWSVTASIEGQKGGGESTGGSYVKLSLSTSVSGEHSKKHGEESSTEWEEPATYAMTVPEDQTLRVVQSVESGKSKQFVTDYLELDLGFSIIDWKHLSKSSSPLHGNADRAGYKNTRSRVLMVVESQTPEVFTAFYPRPDTS